MANSSHGHLFILPEGLFVCSRHTLWFGSTAVNSGILSAVVKNETGALNPFSLTGGLPSH
jgi:hypothetical protein